MLYRLIKFPAKIAIKIYCRHLSIHNPLPLTYTGPLIICCNHPNSFLDAIILTTLFKKPVYSLARGDAFKNKFYARILRSLHMLPVYRKSEGVENIEINYQSFDACKAIFKKKGIVLIFSEGRCENEWHLRPLMKGTARLVLSSWEAGIPLRALPTGINYNDFSAFGKLVQLNFGTPIQQADLPVQNGFGKEIQTFNHALNEQLKKLVVELDPMDKQSIQMQFPTRVSASKKILLFIPSILGYLIHWPLYFPIKKIVKKSAADTGHYDSIMVGALFLTYPFYVLLIALFTGYAFGFPYWIFPFVLMPFFAWSYVQLKTKK